MRGLANGLLGIMGALSLVGGLGIAAILYAGGEGSISLDLSSAFGGFVSAGVMFALAALVEDVGAMRDHVAGAKTPRVARGPFRMPEDR